MTPALLSSSFAITLNAINLHNVLLSDDSISTPELFAKLLGLIDVSFFHTEKHDVPARCQPPITLLDLFIQHELTQQQHLVASHVQLEDFVRTLPFALRLYVLEHLQFSFSTSDNQPRDIIGWFVDDPMKKLYLMFTSLRVQVSNDVLGRVPLIQQCRHLCVSSNILPFRISEQHMPMLQSLEMFDVDDLAAIQSSAFCALRMRALSISGRAGQVEHLFEQERFQALKTIDSSLCSAGSSESIVRNIVRAPDLVHKVKRLGACANSEACLRLCSSSFPSLESLTVVLQLTLQQIASGVDVESWFDCFKQREHSALHTVSLSCTASIRGLFLSDIPVIPSSRNLFLDFISVSRLDKVKEMSNLKRLRLDYVANDIGGIGSLEHCTQLRHLTLTFAGTEPKRFINRVCSACTSTIKKLVLIQAIPRKSCISVSSLEAVSEMIALRSLSLLKYLATNDEISWIFRYPLSKKKIRRIKIENGMGLTHRGICNLLRDGRDALHAVALSLSLAQDISITETTISNATKLGYKITKK